MQLKIQKEGSKDDSKEDKSPETPKLQNGMGMRNKRIYLFTIFYNPVVFNLEVTKGRDKIKLISSSSEELSRLLKSWFPFSLNWTIINV